MLNETVLSYLGNVTVKIKINDKIIKLEDKNAGLPLLRKNICKYLTGNYGGTSEIPQFLDLMYNADPSLDEDHKTWVTYLSNQISLTGKVFEYSAKYDNWVAKFTAIINHNNLLNDVAENDPGEFKLVLLDGYKPNDPESSYQPLAELHIESYMLARITPGTQAIIEWVMQIKNA